MSKKKPHILVVDDELSMREVLQWMLEREGYRVSCAEDGKKAISMIRSSNHDLVLSDIRMGEVSGLDVLKAAKKKNSNTVVIMISAYASAETAVSAMNEGAYDYLPKPFDNNDLKSAIAKALEYKTLVHEEEFIKAELKQNRHFGLLVGNSPEMMKIYKMILQVAKTRSNILITGESGTGKELIARAIHEQSKRKNQPFVPINCGGIPETLLESEFFGHKKGAFTGASTDKKGLLAAADKGTVFLDEIGEVAKHIQVKLLRAVQEKVFMPVGGNEEITVDTRIISATNKNLEDEVISGRFREDLFYRLNVIEIRVPPLRDRGDDIRPLAQHFLERYSTEMGKKISKLSSYAVDMLKKYDFPGNVRELENLIERSVALANTNILLPDSLALSTHKKGGGEKGRKSSFHPDQVEEGVFLDNILEDVEKEYINKAIQVTRGKKDEAASKLGITLRSLRYRMKKLGIGS